MGLSLFGSLYSWLLCPGWWWDPLSLVHTLGLVFLPLPGTSHMTFLNS